MVTGATILIRDETTWDNAYKNTMESMKPCLNARGHSLANLVQEIILWSEADPACPGHLLVAQAWSGNSQRLPSAPHSGYRKWPKHYTYSLHSGCLCLSCRPGKQKKKFTLCAFYTSLQIHCRKSQDRRQFLHPSWEYPKFLLPSMHLAVLK